MKLTNYTKSLVALAIAAVTFVGAQAEAALYHVSVDTSALQSAPGAPFALDFQLIGGNALSNTVTISNFTYGGGAATSDPFASTFGLASGTLQTGVTLTSNSSNFLNEFYQGFAPGSVLGFDVNLTTNVNGPTPDGFSFSILDQNLENLPTNGVGNSYLLVNIDGSTPSFVAANGVTFSAIPEPNSALFMGALVVGAVGIFRRRSLLVA